MFLIKFRANMIHSYSDMFKLWIFNKKLLFF